MPSLSPLSKLTLNALRRIADEQGDVAALAAAAELLTVAAAVVAKVGGRTGLTDKLGLIAEIWDIPDEPAARAH